MHMLGKLYVRVRRVIRYVVVKHPFLNKSIGNRLRRLDSKLRLWEKLNHIPSEGTMALQGILLQYTADDLSTIHTMKINNDYSPEIVQTMKNILFPGMTFVDLGANIGYISLIAARHVTDSGHVYAFEPNPKTAITLKLNVKINGFEKVISVEQQAISSQSGIVRFVIPPGNSVAARITNDFDSQQNMMIEVESTSLDEYFEEIGWPKVDLIKIDIEGAEIFAFQGMHELSSRNPDLKVIFEYSLPQQRLMKISHKDLFKAIEDCGFSSIRLITPGYDEGSWDIASAIINAEKYFKERHIDLLCEKQ